MRVGILVAFALAALLAVPTVADDAPCADDGRVRLCVSPARDAWVLAGGEAPEFEMTFTNLGATSVSLPYPDPWRVYDREGHLFAAPVYLTVAVDLPPGASTTSTWPGDSGESFADAASHADPLWLALTQSWNTPLGDYRVAWPYWYAGEIQLRTIDAWVAVDDGLPAP